MDVELWEDGDLERVAVQIKPHKMNFYNFSNRLSIGRKFIGEF